MQFAPHEQAFEACSTDLSLLLPSLSLAGSPPATPGTLTGVWQRVQASQVATRYNMFNRPREHDPVAALNQSRNTYQYSFRPDGQYLSEMAFANFSRYRRVETVLAPAPVPAPCTRRFILGTYPQYGTRFPHPGSDGLPRRALMVRCLRCSKRSASNRRLSSARSVPNCAP